MFLIDTIIIKNIAEWEKIAIINNESVNFKLDSGADFNVISYKLLGKFRINERNINNFNIKVKAFWWVYIKCEGKNYTTV